MRSQSPEPIPPLENGDNLTSAEFLRRYEAMPEGTRAELINGIVYMSPPVSTPAHGRPHFLLSGLFFIYYSETPGLDASDNASIRLQAEQRPQPDLFLMIRENHGGQAVIDEDGYVKGAPELIAEIAASSASCDLHQKLDLYHRSGVREYLVWRTLDSAIDLFALSRGEAEIIRPDGGGVVRSEVFPGLWIDTAALIAGDLARSIATLRAGLASSEHAAFVEQLAAKAARR